MSVQQKTRHSADINNPDAARNTAIPTTLAATAMETMAGPRRNSLRRALEDYPSQSAQLISLPFVVICMAMFGGFSLFRQIVASVAVGDTIGGITLAGVSIYALVASSAISQMREGVRASDHDREEATKTAAIQANIAQMERRMEQDRKQDRKEVREGLEDIADRIDRLIHEYIGHHSNEWHTRKNTRDVWDNQAPGSTYNVVGGQCRFDIASELRSDGTLKLAPDYERLVPWLKRYGPNGVARANIVLFDDPSSRAPASVTPQIAYHLTAFRALKKLAKAYNTKLRLDCIRFYVQKNSNVRQSFFVGECAFGKKRVEFVNRYTDYSAMFNLPKTLLNGDVETSYAPDTIAKYRHLAEVLRAESASLSLDDLEQRYGHSVPDPDFDPTFTARNPDAVGVSDPDDMIDEIVAFDDHLAIRRRPKY